MIRFFATRPVLTNSLFILLLSLGTFLLFVIPVESLPDVPVGMAVVVTYWPGASPEDIEKSITIKIEQQVKDVKDILWIKSYSQHGMSRIAIKFDEDLEQEDYDRLYLDMQSEIKKVDDLPEGAQTPFVVKVDVSVVRPTLIVALGGNIPEVSRVEIAKELKEELLQLPGMSKVKISGEREREIKVLVDREATEQHNISLLEIVNLIKRENQNLSGGTLKMEGNEILVRPMADIQSIKELQNLIVISDDVGNVVRLGEIASIHWGYEKWEVMNKVQGFPAIFLTCVKKKEENTLTIIPKIKTLVAEFHQRMPSGVTYAFFRDNILYIDRVLSVLKNNLSLGLLMVLLVLWTWIGFNNAILATFGIVFSFLCSLIFLYYTDNSLNEIVLVSFVLVSGMIVDDAIIIIENIYRHHEEGSSLIDAAIYGSAEVFWPVISATATTVAAFLPMLIMSGTTGKVMALIPKTVSFALLASLIEAFLILPSHYVDLHRLTGSQRQKKKSKKFSWFMEKVYLPFVRFFVYYRYRCVFLFCFALVVGLITFISIRPIPIILFPSDHHDFWITARLEEKRPIVYTEKKIKKIEKIIESLPKDEIMNYTVKIGQGSNENYEVIFSGGMAQFTVTLNPHRKSERSADEIMQDVRIRIARANLKEFLYVTVDHLPEGPQRGKAVAVRIWGKHLEQLLEISAIIKSRLEKMPGVSQVADNVVMGKNEILIKFDDNALKRYHLTREQVVQTINAAVEGIKASEVQGIEEQYKIRVSYKKNDLTRVNDVGKIKVKIPDGAYIRVDDVAEFSYQRGFSHILHYNNKRTVIVTANINTAITTSTEVNTKLKNFLEPYRQKYSGYIWEFGGEFEETTRSFNSLKYAFIIAIILIYLILGTQFNSFLQPGIIMSIIPFSLIGVVYGLWVFDFPFTMLTFIGTVGLAGIVVNDSLVLIDFINRERCHMPVFKAVIHASSKRLRPIILTTLTTVLGLLPLSLGLGGKSIVWSPMATAFSWGLFFSTLLTLFVVPAIYMILEDITSKFGKKNE